jgi:hypothetical protein
MSEAENQLAKIVIFVDDPRAHRNKESACGLEKFERRSSGGDIYAYLAGADIYFCWGLCSWSDADASGASVLEFQCHSRLSDSIDSIFRIIQGNKGARVVVKLNCECSGEQVRMLESSGCAIMPAYNVRRHVSKVMRRQLIQDWMTGQPISLPMAPGDPAILNAASIDREAAPLHEAITHAQSAAEQEDLVFAVVSPPRSGSMALADFISLSVPARFPVFHEHDWAKVGAGGDGSMKSVKGKPPGRAELIKHRMTEAFIAKPSPFRYIFSLHRNPLERLRSYFVKVSREHFTAAQLDVETVRQEFEAWLDKNIRGYLQWLDVRWPAMVGFRQSEMEMIAPGIRHRRDANQSVTVIDISRLGLITQNLLDQYGRERYPLLRRNSVHELGIGDHYNAFIEACPMPEYLARRVMEHPEVRALAQ